MSLVVSVPTPDLLNALAVRLPEVDLALWDLRGPPPRLSFDLVVAPYLEGPAALSCLAGVEVGLVQGQSIGYDGVAQHLPAGLRYANAAGVHEASTAELAVGLMLAMQRCLPEHVRAQAQGRWSHRRSPALADSRVLVVGLGGVGQAIIDRLAAFEVDIVRVASRARTDETGPVHGVDDLAGLVAAADIVALAVPLSASTEGLIGDRVLAAMRPGTLLVNVARGAVVDTDALVRAVATGGVRAALDVVDPEPLPAEHPLWSLPGVLITPHVGGDTDAMTPRVLRLICEQVRRIRAGEPPVNLVIPAEA